MTGEIVREWVIEWGRHVRDHWQDHLAPALVIFATTFVLANVCIFGGSMTIAGWMMVRAEDATAWDALGMVSVGLLSFGTMALVLIPLRYGYTRYTLRLLDGEKPELEELAWGYRRFVPVLILVTVVQCGVGLGVLLLVIPGIVLGLFLALVQPAYADRDAGWADALRAGWAVAVGNGWVFVLFELLAFALGMLLGFIPLVGAALALPVSVTLQAVAWRAASRRVPPPPVVPSYDSSMQ